MGLHLKPHTDTDIDTNTDAIHAFLKQLPFIADAAADADVDVDVDVSLRRDDSNDFVSLLEAEFLKIYAFQRELPLSTFLLKHVIQVLKQEASQHPTYRDADQPLVLEEFIPLEKVSGVGNTKIKRAEVDDDDDDGEKDECGSDKRNWMSSVQLWTTATMEDAKPSDYISASNNNNHQHTCSTLTESRKLEKEDAREHELSLVGPCMINHLNEQRVAKSGGTTTLLHSTLPSTVRKRRRCWSAELHRRFVDALTKLGGAEVATPKQIRELMGVDGLTNDEVKSHLQKYRLHARRVANKLATGEYSESAKPSSSQSRSPDGPLQFHGPAAGDSMDNEDDI